MLRTTTRWLALVLGAALSSAQAADGALDPTYGTAGAAYLALDGIEGHIAAAFAAAPQADGKLVVAGMRNWIDPLRPYDPHIRAVVARFDPKGAVDAPFGGRRDLPGRVVLTDVVPGTQQQVARGVAVLPTAASSCPVASTPSARATASSPNSRPTARPPRASPTAAG